MDLLSFFESITQVSGGETTTVEQWIQDICAGRWRKAVERTRHEYRTRGKSPQYRALKDRLPAVTPAGIFHRRCSADLSQASSHPCRFQRKPIIPGEITDDADCFLPTTNVASYEALPFLPYSPVFFSPVSYACLATLRVDFFNPD